MDEQTKSKDELTTIAGGVEVEVKYQNNGDKETVKVRQIPISKIEKYAAVMFNEAEAIELYCDRPKGWADTLTMESAIAISRKGQELNLPFFESWWEIRLNLMQVQRRINSTISGDLAKNESSATPLASASSPPPSPITTS